MAEKSKKIVQIEIETNAGKATKEFEQLSNGVLKAADSAEKLDASFDDVYNGMAPLTTRMGEAEDRLYELALAGDTASKEYQELLTKVGEYRKVQIQTDLAVDGAATTMTQKLGSALNGATSGFAATQGAMALFGDENQALEESLLKVQSALAIQQGVQGLTEAYRELSIGSKLAAAGQAAFTFVTGGATTGLKLFRAALISTGVGALVVGLGLLIANFDKVKEVLTDVNKGFKEGGLLTKALMIAFMPLIATVKLVQKGLQAIGVLESDEEKERQKRAKAEEDRAVANANRLQKEIDNLKEIRENIDKNTQAYLRQLNAEIKALEQSKEGLKNKEKIAEIDEQIRQKNIEGIKEEYDTFKETQQLKLEEYEKEIKKNQNRIDAAKARGSSQYKTELFYVEKYTAEANKLRQELNTNNFTEYQEYLNKLEALDIEKAKKEKEDQKASNDRYKQYLQDRLSIARQIEDIENGLLEDGIEKELEINRDKFRRLREDAEKNTKLTTEQRATLIDLRNQEEAQAEAKIIADNQKRREDAFETERSERVELLNFVDELNTAEVESEKAKNLAILDNAVETNEKLIESDKAVAEAKKNIQDAQMANIEAGISLLKDVAGENNKLQALAIAAENAVGIAKIIISTQAANAAAKLKYAAIPGGLALAAAEITANKVSAGIGIAASVAAAAKGIASLKQSASLDSGGNLGGGGAGTEAAVPQFNVVGDSGINQIAQLQQQPVQAFVVSGEVTTSQALDRNRVQNATL